MIDKRSARLISALTQICADGSYKIIEINELIKAMLPRYKIETTELSQIIRFLGDNEMIDVKYSDESVYCISVLPKGRVYEESQRMGQRDKKKGKYGWLFLAAVCFISAFLGSFLAGLI